MKETQEQRLANFLKRYKSIDPLQSWKLLGIYRLSAIVHKLRAQGYNITTERTKVQNQFGEDCSVAKYVYHIGDSWR